MEGWEKGTILGLSHGVQLPLKGDTAGRTLELTICVSSEKYSLRAAL